MTAIILTTLRNKLNCGTGHNKFTAMLNASMIIVIMVNVITLTVIMLSVAMLKVILLSDSRLNVILSIALLTVS
jgi:hypothetical protein